MIKGLGLLNIGFLGELACLHFVGGGIMAKNKIRKGLANAEYSLREIEVGFSSPKRRKGKEFTHCVRWRGTTGECRNKKESEASANKTASI